ncbi:albusnodin family lasso peptide [Streptomyces palmae]|uniref:Albusnodin family lasso peptide n=1 Tax=Streptomyces palmae TaxID=1701085 RepID=A0A4Z0GP95_9ACTN|nr:albusnodin family lasso peptide [Streptomyces palmae]TGA98049.1 albusnodin family lasso peptide [Streptomyces palmae]
MEQKADESTYEPPELTDIGDFADLTLGLGDTQAESMGAYGE